ncbi:hypothetical protein [Aliikangiella coralliicola]|uniref:hypothetical protein n=1 Tax=Aliikangiella coralliicola TaxID=2592383 RepID=UPI00143CE99D|nr:hypothetical protein [Aliikangiella coralliicola]
MAPTLIMSAPVTSTTAVAKSTALYLPYCVSPASRVLSKPVPSMRMLVCTKLNGEVLVVVFLTTSSKDKKKTIAGKMLRRFQVKAIKKHWAMAATAIKSVPVTTEDVVWHKSVVTLR